jgi:hypothetical protein
MTDIRGKQNSYKSIDAMRRERPFIATSAARRAGASVSARDTVDG